MNVQEVNVQYNKMREFLEYAINAFNLGLPPDKKINVVQFMGDFDVLLEYSLHESLKKYHLLDEEHISLIKFLGQYASLEKRYGKEIDYPSIKEEVTLLGETLLMVISILNYQVPTHILFLNMITGINDLFDFVLFNKPVHFHYEDTSIFLNLNLGDELTEIVTNMFNNNEVNVSKFKEIIHNKLLEKLD